MKTEFLLGNIACAEGALAAGCGFFGGYPITPSTEVAEHMARALPKRGGTFIQMEDEIASMASVIGASWAGARAMTATSGPGFSLMMENIGYAVMTETPCVIVNIQRGGPSTGQPTLAAQGDMLQCRFGSHGDYSIVAISPSSVQEMFDLTVRAFNISDMLRIPVFLMADESIGHMRESITIPEDVERTERKGLKEGYRPFEPEDDMVPGFSVFGSGDAVPVTGLTHNDNGYPDATNYSTHDRLVRRLYNKVESRRHELADYDVRNPEAETVFISYGAPSRTVMQVLHDHPGGDIGHLNIRTVWPFSEKMLEEFPDAKTFLVPEMNLGQISREIQRHTDIDVVPVSKLGGELHTPGELVKAMGAVI